MPLFVRRLFATLLLALWLPATLHCSLEESGWLPETCPQNCADQQTHAPDGCGTVEDGSYRPAGDVLQVNTPALYAWLGDFCCPLLQELVDQASRTGPGDSLNRPLDWISSWQFVRRLAPPARAPSLAAA